MAFLTDKEIFDAIRARRGMPLTQGDVDAINKVLYPISAENGVRTPSQKCLNLIKEFEGLELNAYPDPATKADPWTIGIGTTVYPSGKKVKRGDRVTVDDAFAFLRFDLDKFAASIRRLFPVTTQNQFDALLSMCYNVGPTNMEKSTLRKLHNEGRYAEAAIEFAKWNKAGGKVMSGLTRRRAAEAALYRQ